MHVFLQVLVKQGDFQGPPTRALSISAATSFHPQEEGSFFFYHQTQRIHATLLFLLLSIPKRLDSTKSGRERRIKKRSQRTDKRAIIDPHPFLTRNRRAPDDDAGGKTIVWRRALSIMDSRTLDSSFYTTRLPGETSLAFGIKGGGELSKGIIHSSASSSVRTTTTATHST